jgi:adenylosuccinate synthase
VPSTVVVGAQWGDEGKGRIVDLFASQVDMVVRYHGGSNAGHTIMVGDEVFAFHLLPSGILSGKFSVIGSGLVVDLGILLEEKQNLEKRGIQVEGNLALSDHCHLILPYHKALEKADEARLAGRRIGTTLRGIGPAYTDKASRRGIRLGELNYSESFREHLEHNIAEKNEILTKIYGAEPLPAQAIYDETMGQFNQIANMVTDTSVLVNDALDEGKEVLFEGAHGALLDIDFGTYPYVTSSNALAGAVCAGVGIGPTKINRIIGVVKAYTTRVGEGPFPTQCEEELASRFRTQGREYGSTTGRPRRVGWFDAVIVRKAVRINGMGEIAITHLDVLDQFDSIPVCVSYEREGERIEQFPNLLSDLADCKPICEALPGWKQDTSGARRWEDLPAKAQQYVAFIEDLLKVKASIILVGPRREQTILR